MTWLLYLRDRFRRANKIAPPPIALGENEIKKLLKAVQQTEQERAKDPAENAKKWLNMDKNGQ